MRDAAVPLPGDCNGSKSKANRGSTTKLSDWKRWQRPSLKGKPLSTLDWQTPRGSRSSRSTPRPISRPLKLPGFRGVRHCGRPPYLRGPRATMYANRPWTIRQYSGFSTAEESNRFYRDNLKGRPMGLSDRLRSGDASRYDATTRASRDVGQAASRSTASGHEILFGTASRWTA